jgi:hypothetical protein
LGLCSQIELDEVIAKAADKRRKMEAAKEIDTDGPGLQPAKDDAAAYEANPGEKPADANVSADDVFRDFS